MHALAGGPVVAPRFGGPQQQARALAVTHLAIHDALNSIEPRYDTYSDPPPAPAAASPDAAIAAAARTNLLAMLGPLPPTVPPGLAVANRGLDRWQHVRLSQLESEQSLSRVYGGLHFLEGCTAGLRQGRQVADWVYARALRP